MGTALAPIAGMLRSVRRARIGAIALMMLLVLLPSAAAFCSTSADLQSKSDLVEQTIAQIDAGQFASASSQIDQVLAQASVDAKLREALEFQR